MPDSGKFSPPRLVFPSKSNVNKSCALFVNFDVPATAYSKFSGLSLRKYCTSVVATHQNNIVLLRGAILNRTSYYGMRVMSLKLNIAKKIAGLEIMTLNHEKM